MEKRAVQPLPSLPARLRPFAARATLLPHTTAHGYATTTVATFLHVHACATTHYIPPRLVCGAERLFWWLTRAVGHPTTTACTPHYLRCAVCRHAYCVHHARAHRAGSTTLHYTQHDLPAVCPHYYHHTPARYLIITIRACSTFPACRAQTAGRAACVARGGVLSGSTVVDHVWTSTIRYRGLIVVLR